MQLEQKDGKIEELKAMYAAFGPKTPSPPYVDDFRIGTVAYALFRCA